jgi:hypothetical protein
MMREESDRSTTEDFEPREDLPPVKRSVWRQILKWREQLTFGVSAGVLTVVVLGLLIASVFFIPSLLVKSPSSEDLASLKPPSVSLQRMPWRKPAMPSELRLCRL